MMVSKKIIFAHFK